MNVNKKHYRTIWVKESDERIIQIIDQRSLPHKFIIEDLKSVDDFVRAIKDMHVRGAPLIGASAGFGMYIAVLNNNNLNETSKKLKATRPTAVNLAWAVDRQLKAIENTEDKVKIALETAKNIVNIKKKMKML